jgi:hypothetical protein
MMTKEQLTKVYGCDLARFDESVEKSTTFRFSGVGMVAISILSDVQEMIAHGDEEGARQAINRVKHLIDKHVPSKHDQTKEVPA